MKNLRELESGQIYIEGQPLNDHAEFTAFIKLTPEQKVWQAVKVVLNWLKENVPSIWEQVCELSEHAELAASKGTNNLMDAILYAANDNPKWWHLYKHAKKYRTRKKYNRLLMKQLLSKLRDARAQEAEE